MIKKITALSLVLLLSGCTTYQNNYNQGYYGYGQVTNSSSFTAPSYIKHLDGTIEVVPGASVYFGKTSLERIQINRY